MGKHAADTTLSFRLPTVGELLEILPQGWVVIPGLHDLVPELTEADRVVVGPGGVFVIVAPEWVGPFGVEGDVLVAHGVTRERETEACLDTAVAVAMVAGTYAEWIVPVLCVTSEELLLAWAMEARVCSLASLIDALTEAPVVLPPSHVQHAAHILQSAGDPRSEPEPEPVATLPPAPAAVFAEPEPEPTPEPIPEPVATQAAPVAAEADTMTLPKPLAKTSRTGRLRSRTKTEPTGEPTGEPTEVAAEPAESTSARSRRVAAAMAAAEETAAQVAADQAARGVAPAKAKRKSGEGASRIKSLVALLVAATVVGGLGLSYDRIVPAVHGVYDQLSGAPACVPARASNTQTLTPTTRVRVPRTDKHGKPLSKAARAKARKRAAARAKRLAVKQVSAPALEAATC